MAPEPTARCRRLRLLAYSSSGVNARGVSNFLQLPGYSARDGLLPCGDGRRDGEVGCRSRHPDTTLRQTADPRMRWTIGGANAILALRSPSLGGRRGVHASLETNACTGASTVTSPRVA